MNKRFCLLFAYPLTQTHLTKETGKIPEVIGRRLGWEVEIVRCSGQPLEELQAGMQQETPHVHLTTLDGVGDGRIEPAVLRYLLAHARDIDVLAVMNFGNHVATYGSLYKLLNPRGFLWNKLDLFEQVVEINDFLPRTIPFARRGVRNWLQRRLMRSIDLMSAESRGVYRILAARYPELLPKLAVVPCGVDAPNMSAVSPTPQRERIILNVARLGAAQKGTDILLEAFAQSSLWPEWSLVLVGPIDADFQAWLAAYAERHPEPWKAVHFTGSISSRSELAQWYTRSSVFCMPSRYESWGLALTEAGYYGCACIATDFYAAVDMLDGGRCGALCALENVGDLADELKRVCADPSLIEKYGREFRQRVAERFTWDKVISDWWSIVTAKQAIARAWGSGADGE